MTVFVLVTSEGSEVIDVQTFARKEDALEERRQIEAEDTYSDDTHGIELYERQVQ